MTRWVVPSLQGTIRRLKEARENRTTAIKTYKFRLFDEFDTDRGVWLRAVRVLAELDCLFSLAKSSSALGEPSCRPEFVEGDASLVDFEELRHPALCVRNDFIPNDVKLGGDVGRIALLTGECSSINRWCFCTDGCPRSQYGVCNAFKVSALYLLTL